MLVKEAEDSVATSINLISYLKITKLYFPAAYFYINKNSNLQMTTLECPKLVDCEIHITGMEQRPDSLAEILQALFMADHDAMQLEQYLLEKEHNIDT